MDIMRGHFEAIVADALQHLPPQFLEKLDNVGVVIEEENEDDPELLGLYEGVPQTQRDSGYTFVMPDKITLFQTAIEQYAAECAKSIREVIKDVIWHEIAHHKGYDDQELEEMELKRGITG